MIIQESLSPLKDCSKCCPKFEDTTSLSFAASNVLESTNSQTVWRSLAPHHRFNVFLFQMFLLKCLLYSQEAETIQYFTRNYRGVRENIIMCRGKLFSCPSALIMSWPQNNPATSSGDPDPQVGNSCHNVLFTGQLFSESSGCINLWGRETQIFLCIR